MTKPEEAGYVSLASAIETLIDARNESRKRGDNYGSRSIEVALDELGVVLTETKNGTRWTRCEQTDYD